MNPATPTQRRRHFLAGGITLVLCLYGSSTLSAAVAAEDGQKVYEQACAKCHSAGPGAFFTGAPKLGAASWPMRLAKAGSVEELVSITAQGKNKMPAQGGVQGLSDEDIKAAIEYILNRAPFP